MKLLICVALLAITACAYPQDKTTATDTLRQQETELKNDLEEVVVEQKKKAVERKPDRTIFNFSDQPHLNSGSLYEGLRKLPGLMISDIAGMMYQGRPLEVYMDGRPLNIYSNDLNAYLEGMPANAIEKVEIITQPGAEFPATSGGAIINIVTSGNAKKYLSASYSNGYSYTHYGTSRHRLNNSVTLSSGNSLFSWQLNGGQSYNESYQTSRFTNNDVVLTENVSDRANRFYYLKSGIKFDLKKDRLLLNYDMNSNNNSTYVTAAGLGFASDDKAKTVRFYHDVTATYQKRFEDTGKKLDFRFIYNNSNSDFGLDSRLSQNAILDNNSDQEFYQFKTDYSQEINLLDKTKISAGILADRLDFEAANFGAPNLNYRRSTFAFYTEAQATLKKFDFILGGRLESYDISGHTDVSDLIPFSQTQFFPNAAIQYNVTQQVYAKANYNRKISLPNTSSLNPNNTNYQNPNVAFFGNPYLEPTIFNNYEVSVSAFDYFSIGYYYTDADNLIINRIIDTPNGAASISQNLEKATIHNFNIGLPVPFMLFTKGLAETLKMDFNLDEINFLYLYAGSQKHIIPGLDTKAVWYFNATSQFVLPKKLKLSVTFNTSVAGGNVYYYTVSRPMNQEISMTLSRKFLADNLSITLYANDLLNTNKQLLGSAGTALQYGSGFDSRRIGFSLSYKIPTRNKLAKEANILLNDKQQQDPGTLTN